MKSRWFLIFFFQGHFLFPVIMIFSLGTAFHAPVLFFVFRVRLLLSSDRTRWIIRCVSIQVAVPTVLIHLPICSDALDRARYELSLSRSPSASGSSAQIV